MKFLDIREFFAYSEVFVKERVLSAKLLCVFVCVLREREREGERERERALGFCVQPIFWFFVMYQFLFCM
jgi:hypothetical protein